MPSGEYVMFSCYIGYWEGNITVSPCVEDEHFFRNVGPLGLIIDGRTIALLPDLEGGNDFHNIERARNFGLGLAYVWAVKTLPWARFKRHEVEVDIIDDGLFTWEVPSDHTLPWPCFISRGGPLDIHAVAQRELFRRGVSAWQEGGDYALRMMLRGVPDKVRRLLSGPTWRNTLDSIHGGT